MHTQQVSRPCAEEVVLAVSLELAMAKWKVALHDGRRDRPTTLTRSGEAGASETRSPVHADSANRVPYVLWRKG
ncbi:hypothetical protein BZM27_19600 [Paraburkholderia steynii]|uniref:Uncharacterized protein n=1 Tax=Paraburkholderia steynii TaxID=1245441 RepID=A0A4R0XJT5_9BURK|nr:hypothetical protein BZM27_19600 [Paraburkholderia steynii]